MGNKRQKKGKAAKNAKKGICNGEPEEIVKAPHSFVINRGKLGKNGHELLINFRKMMEPFTASQLKVQKQNVLKDFIHIAGPLNVTHLVIFTKTQNAMYLRTAKLPHGPTLTFQIKEYSLVKDIISSQKKSVIYEKLFEHHPLLVLNNFSGDGMHIKLMATTFQHMLPSINVNKTNLNVIRRCLLLNYDADDNSIDLRQYAIKVVPTGMSRAVKKLIQSRVPNLSQFQDIGDFLEKSGNLSESEAELDGAANTVTLPQPISSRGNIASEKSAIRLYEIGPRLTLKLVKIEEGLMTGEVLYHEYITKTPEEIEVLKKRIKTKKLLKEKRKAEQQKNVQRKLAEKTQKESNTTDVEKRNEKEDDLKWYRKEVGHEPDDSLLPSLKKRKSIGTPKDRPAKRVKFSGEDDNKQSGSKSKSDKNYQDYIRKKKRRKEIKLSKQKGKKTSKAIMPVKEKDGFSKKQKSKNL